VKSIELFAGVGGLGLGLHLAGFEPAAVIERDHACCEVLRGNQARGAAVIVDWPLVEADTRDVDFGRYAGAVRLVSGGPPCQPFSLGGRHGAYSDPRDMFPEAIRAVRQAAPEAFVFENVKGLTRSSFRDYLTYLRRQLECPEIERREGEAWSDHFARLRQHRASGSRSSLAYRVAARVIDAADHGVPQRRERQFLVGFREDLNIEWRAPKATHSREASKPGTRPWRTVRDAIGDLPDPETDPAAAAELLDHRFQPGARPLPGTHGKPAGRARQDAQGRVHGVPGGENMFRRRNGDVLYFTVRESARLQTFPDDFEFRGSWSEAMRQLGNAVPVQLARIVGESVARELLPRAAEVEIPRRESSAASSTECEAADARDDASEVA
jgi:DNA (cytosine-5)-methyltransferase 1